MPQTVRKVWFFNKLAMLCRTTGRDNKNHCVRIASRDDATKLELSNPQAGFRYEATILKGRQLPEHAPKSTAAMPTEFLSQAEIREVVVGNTLNFRKRNGQNLSVYFDEDGTVAVRGSHMSRTVRRKWFFNKFAMLCRTIRQDDKNHCVKVAKGSEPKRLDLSNPQFGVRYEATILKGRQLPE